MAGTTYHEQPAARRAFKDSIFRMLFSDKEKLLTLYNAVNGTNYQDPGLLEVNTLKNAIYMAVHNDISFLAGDSLSLYEHQSTCSGNLTLRFLFYVSDLFSSLTRDSNLYGRKGVRLPAPRFLIFYNGEEETEERKVLRLSELYAVQEDQPALELEAVLLNINPGYNEKPKQDCPILGEYVTYTTKVRQYAKEMELTQAVERAMEECIREGILADFLQKNRSEAKKVSIYEYDAERHIRMEREEAMEEGMEKGIVLGQQEMLMKQVQKKLQKGYTLPEIADALETEEAEIQKIMKAMEEENIPV